MQLQFFIAMATVRCDGPGIMMLPFKSESGIRTKARSSMRGCGIVSSRVLIIVSVSRRISKSSVRSPQVRVLIRPDSCSNFFNKVSISPGGKSDARPATAFRKLGWSLGPIGAVS